MAIWPANGTLNWNTAMLTYLAVEHNTDGTHKDLTYENLVVDDIKTKSPWVDVTHPDFGATGDGSTDDSTAIQAAFDSVPNQDIPTTIFFPTGKYLLESTLVVRSGRRLILRGAGKTGSDSTTLLTTNANLDFIDAYSALTNVFSVHGLQFEGPGIDTGTGNAITLGELRDGGVLGGPGYGRAYDSTITDCWFTLIPDKCIFLQRAADYQIYGNGIENCNYGIYIVDGGTIDGGQNIQLNRFYANKKAGIYIEVSSWDTINGNRFDHCGIGIGDDTAGAIVINNSVSPAIRSTLIATNTFDKNTNDIVLLGTVAGTTQGIWNTHIVGNTSDFAIRHFIYIDEAKRTSIIGNRINDASGGIVGTYPAIVIGGDSDGTVIFDNVNTIQNPLSDYQATYGLELGANTINTVLGTNSFTGKTGNINIVSGATLANPTVTPATVHNIGTLVNDATPSVAGRSAWLTGGTTTITDFDDGVTGQVFTIIAEHSLIITDGTNIFLSGSSNWAMTATDTLTLIQKADGLWYETSRSDSGA